MGRRALEELRRNAKESLDEISQRPGAWMRAFYFVYVQRAPARARSPCGCECRNRSSEL